MTAKAITRKTDGIANLSVEGTSESKVAYFYPVVFVYEAVPRGKISVHDVVGRQVNHSFGNVAQHSYKFRH